MAHGFLKFIAVVTAIGAIHSVVGDEDAHAVTVNRVIDGDTIEVNRDNELVRVRLLNIDTPETVDPNVPMECLGPEASDFLKDLLPRGSEIRLEYDTEKADDYGRELAGVYLGDTLINAEVARAGYGVPMVIGENDRFYPDVESAWDDAQSAQLGFFSPTEECTAPGMVASALSMAYSLPASASGEDLEALVAYRDVLNDVLQRIVAAELLLGSSDDLRIRGLNSQVGDLIRSLTSQKTKITNDLQSANDDIVAKSEELANEQAEAEQRAREQATADQAAAEQEQEQAANSDNSYSDYGSQDGSSYDDYSDAGSYADTSSQSSNSGAADTSQQNSGSDRPGNTAPCRAYRPGGNGYVYIDCATKAPIDGIVHFD